MTFCQFSVVTYSLSEGSLNRVTLVRFCTEYGIHFDRIESVQKTFLLFALRRLN